MRALLLLLLLLFAAPAQAVTIYFAGGEDVDFSIIGIVVTATTAGDYRASYARLALRPNSDNAKDPQDDRFVTPTFSSVSTLWVHTWTTENGVSANNGGQFVGIYGSDGVRRLLIRNTAVGGQVKISKRNSAGTITDLVTCTQGPWPALPLTSLDWFINYAVSGQVTLYANGVQFCNFTGDVTTDGVTAVNQADFASGTGGGNSGVDYSEVIIADSDTRGLTLQTLVPQAAGTTQQWAGAVVGNLNGTTYNDASFNLTTTNNQISDWTIPSIASGSWTVVAVKQAGRIAIGATGPQHFSFTCRPNGAADTASGSITPNGAFGNYATYWTANCATSSAWAVGDFTGANFGVESLP